VGSGKFGGCPRSSPRERNVIARARGKDANSVCVRVTPGQNAHIQGIGLCFSLVLNYHLHSSIQVSYKHRLGLQLRRSMSRDVIDWIKK
jgi:hypothetical protein